MTAPSEAAPAAGRRQVPYWQAGLGLTLLLGGAYLVRRHWPTVEDGAVRLAVADQGWLLLGALAALGTWASSALAQQGAVTERLPGGRLVAAQFAASAANHLLPAGLGAGAVNVRFLMRCGLPAGRSASALAVKATAGVVVRLALIGALAPACPGLLRIPHAPTAVFLAVPAAAALVAALFRTRWWPRCRGAVGAVSADIRAVHASPARSAALWGGSLAFAALHSLVLIAVTQAIELPLSPTRVMLLYLAASGAAALLPTPGGLGSLDAALALALTASGTPAAAAASAVLGYRLLTVWLPLLPGLLVLGLLIRRRAL
ncbi:lysylphosphatidylglycerol synthase domain-containing protein [Streptomyces arenae]|uniref:lysylphosphatidylglycerol synthase domain-containing protein n=1 Tax=Streptomyces arenae TaxID=29301 RepID=UPI0026589899|nr:lysylphosphatidylglycerol synthase domain-containing protein [Streptomyces arenae]MCG7208119.1 lysylphosphatidylglycerol synthase domain-containing protein [Streptomyces arenae]